LAQLPEMKHMRKIILPLIFLTSFYSCSQTVRRENDYAEHVGDISFDKDIDDPNFNVCDENKVFQYYNFGKGLRYEGEKSAINQYFKDKANLRERQGETGFLTIRFIVNCEGKTGRFRIQGMDANYKEKQFEKGLVDELLSLTRQLDGWIVARDDKNRFDYYQYLTIKIENGKLIEIMP
jgi:hypothetical protein